MTSSSPASVVHRLRVVARELSSARIARQWTQQEFARRLGVSRRTVQHLENGSPGVKFGTVLEAAHLLGADLAQALSSTRAAPRPIRRRVRRDRATERELLDF